MRDISGKWKVTVIFLAAVFLYGIYVSLFSSTVYKDADEEIYLALAKSFHYSGNFSVNKEIVNYNCVLYSVLISFLYYFYSPDKILFYMRLMGVVVMCSSVFPIWLLAKRILNSGKAALIMAGCCMLLPCMFNTAYLMQETLVYPLFMWFLYIFYCQEDCLSGKVKGRNCFRVFLAALLSILCFFTKTCMMFIPVTVNLLWIFQGLKKREKHYGYCLLLYDLVCVLAAGMGYFGVYAVNGFVQGSNHYSGQLSWLFPITLKTIKAGVFDSVVYWALLLLNLGVIPAAGLIVCYKKWEGADKSFCQFCLLGLLVLVEEIIVLIVLTEEGVDNLPHKFLFRYFQIFVPPVLILFAKIKENVKIYQSRLIYVSIAVSVIIAAIYFAVLGGNTRQAVTDGFLYMMLENVAKLVLPYGDVMGVLGLGILLAGISMLLSKSGMRYAAGVERAVLTMLLLFWLANGILLPVYTNNIVGGKQIEKDSIQAAEYLNRNGYSELYYIDESDGDDYRRNFYGYLRQEYSVIYKEEIEDILAKASQPTAFLAPEDSGLKEMGALREVFAGEELCLYIGYQHTADLEK